MADMLVKLFDVKEDLALLHHLMECGISIKKALSPDRITVVKFIENNIQEHWGNESKTFWMSECEAAFSNSPPSCYVAVKEKAIIGFACYNATAKGFFGPTGVLREYQKKGIGKALLVKSLLSMYDDGYGYAIIGWPEKSAIDFYKHTVNAQVIENSSPGIYGRMSNA